MGRSDPEQVVFHRSSCYVPTVKKRVALTATIAVLAFPAGALAAYFSWGYNMIGPNNYLEYSGFSGWDDMYIHKTNGGHIKYGFAQPSGPFCDRPMSGSGSDYYTRAESGCDPYVRVMVQWNGGNQSYLFFDSYD